MHFCNVELPKCFMYKYGLAILRLFCVCMIHHTTYFNVANESRDFHCYRKMLEPRGALSTWNLFRRNYK